MLAATDPAQPYGAALPWPKRDDEARRPQRVAGAYVVLAGAEPVLYVERGGKGIAVARRAPTTPRIAPGARGAGARSSPPGAGASSRSSASTASRSSARAWEALLIELGFRAGPRKLTLSA